VSGHPTRASALSTAREGVVLGDECNEIGVAHSTEAASAVHSTVGFFIASSLQVSRKHNTVPACPPIKFGRLECGQGRLGGTMSLRYRIASGPMFLSGRFVNSRTRQIRHLLKEAMISNARVTVSGRNTLRTTPTSPNIHFQVWCSVNGVL